MERGVWRRRSGGVVAIAVLLLAGLLMVMTAGCGGSDSGSDAPASTEAPSSPSSTSQPAADGEGVLLAEEIMATFDEMAAEVAVLVEDMPEPAVLKPQLEALYGLYEVKMTELNTRYLALRDADTVQFGQCNGRISNLRPVRHSVMQDSIVEAIRHYNFDLGDQEIVELLSSRPLELLDIAVDQGQ